MALKPALLGALLAFCVSGPVMAQGADYLRDAEAAARSGDRLTAIHLYQSAMIAAPRTPEPYLEIAEFYAAGGDWILSRKYFAIALELEPASPIALKGLAFAALALGDVASAQTQLDILNEACAPACVEAAEVGNAITAHGLTTSE